MGRFLDFPGNESRISCAVIPAQAGIRPNQMCATNGWPGRVPGRHGEAMLCMGAGMTEYKLRKVAVFSIAVLFVFAGAAHAEVKGSFIGPGTYATKEGCEKLAKIAAGGDKNAGTVPEALSVDGFHGWEGACTFRSVTEKVKGRVWSVNMDCAEGITDETESDIFEKLSDGSFKVTVMDKSTVYQRCDTTKGK